MTEILNDFSEKDITYTLYGLLLGDGYYKNGWIENNHTNKQRFYVEWLESLFKNYGLKTSSRYDYMAHSNLGDYIYSRVNIKVPNKFYFENGYKFFNTEGKKIVSSYVLEHINLFGLLLWYLDDGCLFVSTKDNRTKRFAYLNTQSFTYEENIKIQQSFKERFDIDLRIHTDCSGFEKYKESVYYRLYFNATNFRKFYDLLRPYLQYIPKEFYYKFNMKYFPNRVRINTEYSEKYNMNIA